MNKLMIRHTMDKPLPYDAEVEYIENDGQCIIDSGILSNSNLTIEAKFYIPRITGTIHGSWLYGGRNLNNTIQMQGFMIPPHDTSNTAAARYYTQVPCPRNYEGIVRVSQSRNVFRELEHNDTVTFDTYSFSLNTSIWIFGFNASTGTHQYGNTNPDTRLYYWRVFNGTTLLQDLIPVRKGNRGMMYDRVTGRLFDRIDDGLDAHFIPGPDYNPFAYQYLTFVPLEDSIFSFSKRGTGNDIEYSIDGGAWTSLASEANTPTIGAGHNIRWRAELTPSTVSDNQGIGTFSATGLYDAMGNTMSLLYGDNYIGQTTLVGTYTFCNLWREDAHIYKADRMVLPAMSLSTACYNIMFYKCTSLVTAPKLPATTLAAYCYDQMFSECTSLTSAPELPAISLVENCYSSMFNGCTSLTAAPELPATKLKSRCYYGMFRDCTSLTTAPELPATTVMNACYQEMLRGCTSLTAAPELPATTLVASCYQRMFYSCTKLKYIKCLATDISATNCLNGWVTNVISKGTFVKDATMTGWTTGTSGIPSGWTVVDDNS